MANTILTPTAVTREALRVLHQKLNFVGSIDRQYDSSFAKSGAKIGSTLKIRKPNQYVVRTGKTLDTQDTTESSETLTVATQKGVDLNFSSAEMTTDLDDFSSRIIDPAMSVLAANIEADALSMYKNVWNEVSDVGAALTYTDVLNGRKVLQDNLAPMGNRTALLDTQMQVDVIGDLKALFNNQAEIGKQMKEGFIGRVNGFDFMENTLLPLHTTGTDDGTGDYLTDTAAAEADGTTGELNVDTGAGSFAIGDIIEIEGVYDVHPETKVSTGLLKRFVITTASTPGAGGASIHISPTIVTSGGGQNVSAAVVDGKIIYKRESDRSTAIAASADYRVSMLYHRDAFTFATADLLMPKGVDFSAREVFDGISMRIVRAYDINNDNMPCRLDVLYGYKAIRPEWACRLGFN